MRPRLAGAAPGRGDLAETVRHPRLAGPFPDPPEQRERLAEPVESPFRLAAQQVDTAQAVQGVRLAGRLGRATEQGEGLLVLLARLVVPAEGGPDMTQIHQRVGLTHDVADGPADGGR